MVAFQVQLVEGGGSYHPVYSGVARDLGGGAPWVLEKKKSWLELEEAETRNQDTTGPYTKDTRIGIT